MPKDLESKIQDLEEALRSKDREISHYREQLYQVNSRLERLVSALSQELHFANLIQKKLSPTEIPHLSGVEFSTKFVPGMRFGGDYFDIFELEDKMKFGGQCFWLFDVGAFFVGLDQAIWTNRSPPGLRTAQGHSINCCRAL